MNRTPDFLEGSFDAQEMPADVMKVRFDGTEMPADFTLLPADILTIPTAILLSRRGCHELSRVFRK